MASTPRAERQRARLAAWVLLASGWAFAACDPGLGLGLPGCDGPPPAVEITPTTPISGAVQGTITPAALTFLAAHRTTLAGLVFDVDAAGWVHVPMPDVDFGAQSDGLGVGVRDMVLALDLEALDLELTVLPDPMRIRITGTDARARIDEGVVSMTVGGDAACRLDNGLGAGPEAAFVHLDFAVDVFVALDAEGRLDVQVELLPFDLRALDFTLVYDPTLPECDDGITAVECRLSCGAGDVAVGLVEALTEALEAELNALVLPDVTHLIDTLVAGLTEQPLALAGVVPPAALAALLPTATDTHPVRVALAPTAGGLSIQPRGAAGEGLGMAFEGGFDTIDHPCVPAVGPPPALRAGAPPRLTGEDQAGAPYHAAFSLSAAAVNRALWVAYRAGVLCVDLDSAEIEALTGFSLNTASLALLLPGLNALTPSPQPLRITLDPAFGPEDAPQLTRFVPVPDDGGIPQVGVRVRLPRLGLSVYSRVEARWSRLFAAEATVALDVVLQAGPGDTFVVSLAQPEIQALDQTYNELLSGADVPGLLDLAADVLAAAVLREGLRLSVPVGGLVSERTGLPLDARIAGLRIDGAEPFMSVLLRLVAHPDGAGLSAEAQTSASLVAAQPGEVALAVGSSFADARYQVRLDEGAWRPLQAAPGGQLVVREPGLRVLGDHTIAVRSVGAGDYASLDPSPAQVAVHIAPAPAPTAPEATRGGCNTRPGPASGGLALLAMLGLLRRRWWAALLLLGCDGRPEAARITCATSAECPGGLACIDSACQRPDACETRADCCPGAECRGGACVAPGPACDDARPCLEPAFTCVEGRCLRQACTADAACPAEHRCVGGHCQFEPPCRAACGLDGACYAAVDACRPAPPSCTETCPPGAVRVVEAPERYLGARCDLDDATCRCVAAPPLVPNDYGRHASMALRAGAPVFAAWDADYGDLVYVTGVETGPLQVRYLDGVPLDAPVLADSAGPRGGRAEPGPDRGRFASLAIDSRGRPHIAYYDATDGDLRYVRGEAGGDWTPPMVVDSEGDVGRGAVLALDALDQPRILYDAVRTADGQAGVRLAYADEAPTRTADWVVLTLQSRASAAPAPLGEVAGRPCMRVGPDGRVHAAWYDREARWPYVAQGRPGDLSAWTVQRLAGARDPDWPDPGGRYANFFTEHDLGRFCDVVPDPSADGLMAVFADTTTDALVFYRGGLAEGVFELVAPLESGRRVVGADPALALDAAGRPVVAYQDATHNDVGLALRTAEGWTPLLAPELSAGAVGFYNSLVVEAEAAVIGTLSLRTGDDGRGAHRPRVIRVPLAGR